MEVELRNRIVYAGLGIIIASLYIFWNNFIISSIFYAVFSTILIFEFKKIFSLKQLETKVVFTTVYLFIVIFNLVVYLKISSQFMFNVTIIILFSQFFFYSIYLIVTNQIQSSINKTVHTFFVSFYILVILFQFLKVKHFFWFNDSIGVDPPIESSLLIYYTLYPFYISWGIDIFAFFAGKLIGGKKIGIVSSPNKTWIGLIFAFLFAPLGFYVYREIINYFSPHVLEQSFFNLSHFNIILFSLLITIIGIYGDLIASLHKRDVNLKNSGDFLKGHGGFYDRIDSTIIINFIFYYFLYFFH